MKKNNFKSLAAVLSLAMATTVVPVNTNAAAAPKITVSKKTVYSGKTYSATVTNLKKGYTVQFSSTEGGVNFKTKKVKATGKKVTAKFTVKAAKSIADGAKTKIKAVVKDTKGKTVKTVSQSVTLKQLATGLTVKDVEKTTVTVGEVVNADATIAPAAAKGAYKKTFTSSDSSVLKVTNASNGLFEAVAPGKATITVSAANDKGKVVEGSKSIEITVVAAEEEKPSDETPVTPEKPEDTTGPAITTGSAITTDYKLAITASKAQITADNVDSADITLKLTAPTDAVVDKNMVAAAQLALGTSGVGSLSADEVNLEYVEAEKAWVGKVKFTSASLTADATSKITASISSVINGPEGVNLKGVSAEPVEITLVAPVKVAEDDKVGAKALKVVSEDLDRVTITFNKSVKRENYLTVDGKVANGKNSQTVAGVTTSPVYFELYIKNGVSDKDSVTDLEAVKLGKTFDHTDITDIVQVSDNTLTFVLANERKGIAQNCLTDNSKFLVDFIDSRDENGYTKVESGVLNNRTLDTTNPTVMKVSVVDLKTLRVQFDQPVYSVKEDAAAEGKEEASQGTPKEIINALSAFNYTIDGQILSKLWKDKDGVYIYGDPNDPNKKVSITLEDSTKRDTVLIQLGKDKDGNQRYLASGNHVLQVANVGDYAALTETGSNNRVVTKNFDFNVPVNNAEPDFNVTVQSPEQFKLTFTTPVASLDKYADGQEIADADLPVQLQYKDTSISTMTDYANVTALGQSLKVTKLADDVNGNPQVKVEVTTDWTKLEGYTKDHKNYYSYLLRLFVAKDAIRNAANGKTNAADRVKPLTDNIIRTVDATTPVIQEITELSVGTRYLVSFSEPIQANNKSLYDAASGYYGHAFTPNGTVGEMTAQIVNNKTTKTYSATIVGWGTNEDTSVIIDSATKLEGGEYTLYVRGVSDDIGNTSNTLSRTFTVEGAVDDSFKILTILADKSYDPSSGSGIYALENPSNNDGKADAIYVEFSTQYLASPIANSVLNTGNWTINGAALPVGSTIISGIAGGKDGGAVSLKDGHSGVTIYLPDGTLTNIESTSVKIAPTVLDVNGKKISGMTTLNTQAIFEGSTFDAANNITQEGTVGFYNKVSFGQKNN